MNEIDVAAEKLATQEESHNLNSAENKMIAGTDSSTRGYSDANGRLDHKRWSDEQLIRSFVRDEDEKAFNEIVNRYADKIFRLALRITCEPSDAEEILREVFLTVEKLDTLQGKPKFSTWLYKVAANASYVYLRANKKRCKNEPSLEDCASHIESGALDGLQIDNWINIPDGALLSREGIEIIQRVVNELPEQYRIVFHLRDVERLTNHDVAKILGLSLAAVKSRILRARHLVRERLSDHFYGSRK
jgi:RNA polymerase sigma-70 factor (ECF subfamily)